MAGDMEDMSEMSDKERQHKYQIEDDVRTLTKAEEVKKDKKRYDEACKMMKDQKMMMDSAMMGGKWMEGK